MSSPPCLLLLLYTHLSRSSYNQWCLEINYLVVFVRSDHFIAISVLQILRSPIHFLVVCFIIIFSNCVLWWSEQIEIILYLPAACADFEHYVCKMASIFPIGHSTKIAERPVNYCHVDFGTNVTRRYSAKRSPIDSNLTLNAHLFPHIVVYGFNIFFQIVWRRSSFGTSIRTVVPCHHINSFVQKEFKIECVRQMDHLLIEHCIRVAQNEARSFL